MPTHIQTRNVAKLSVAMLTSQIVLSQIIKKTNTKLTKLSGTVWRNSSRRTKSVINGSLQLGSGTIPRDFTNVDCERQDIGPRKLMDNRHLQIRRQQKYFVNISTKYSLKKEADWKWNGTTSTSTSTKWNTRQNDTRVINLSGIQKISKVTVYSCCCFYTNTCGQRN